MSKDEIYFTRSKDYTYHNQTAAKEISPEVPEVKEKVTINSTPYFMFNGSDVKHSLTASQAIKTNSSTWFTDSDKWNSTKLSTKEGGSGSLSKLINAANNANQSKSSLSVNADKISSGEVKNILNHVSTNGTTKNKIGKGTSDLTVTVNIDEDGDGEPETTYTESYTEATHYWDGSKERKYDVWTVDLSEELKTIGEGEIGNNYTKFSPRAFDTEDDFKSEEASTFKNGTIKSGTYNANSQKNNPDDNNIISSTFNTDNIVSGKSIKKETLKDLLERIITPSSAQNKDNFEVELTGEYKVTYTPAKAKQEAVIQPPTTVSNGKILGKYKTSTGDAFLQKETYDSESPYGIIKPTVYVLKTTEGGGIKIEIKSAVWTPTAEIETAILNNSATRSDFENVLINSANGCPFYGGEVIDWGDFQGNKDSFKWGKRKYNSSKKAWTSV